MAATSDVMKTLFQDQDQDQVFKTKTKTFIFVLKAPGDQDPGLEDYITDTIYTYHRQP